MTVLLLQKLLLFLCKLLIISYVFQSFHISPLGTRFSAAFTPQEQESVQLSLPVSSCDVITGRGIVEDNVASVHYFYDTG